MDFDMEGDPEIVKRHKAVFDDLANEIDALDSDGEDDGAPAQPVQKNNLKGGTANKKYKVEPDDDMDFPKFDNTAFKELEAGLKMKNNFDDLEREIMDLSSEGEDNSHGNRKPHTSSVKETISVTKQSGGSITRQVQETKVVTQVSGNSPVKKVQESAPKASTKSASVPFPFNLYSGADPKKLIVIDSKLHGKDNLMTLGLVEYEIDEIIDPCLDSSSVDPEIKKHLETKKKSLMVFKNNITGLFDKGSLDPPKYIQLIAKMKTANINVAKDLQKSNAPREMDRVKQRLKILVDEEKEYLDKPAGGNVRKISQAANSRTESKKKEASLADSLRSVPESKINKILPSEIDGLSSEELATLLKKRKDQWWNLAMYINKEMLKHLEGNELNQKKAYLQNSLLPVITKAGKLIENFDNEDSETIAEFLKTKLLEVTPAQLHGKSLQERAQDVKNIMQSIETCTNEETDYIDKLRATLDDSTQLAGPSGKKVKDGEKALEKYAEYTEYLSKLTSDKFMWVPTPIVNIAKEQRTVQLVNKDIDARVMLVRLKGLENLTHRKYYIRWSVEAAQGTVSFTTPNCDEHSLQFNYQQIIQMTNKEKLDPEIEKKQIHIEVLYKQMFMEKTKADGAIPLAGLRKSNTLEGKVKLRNDGIELSYLIKVREPLLKHIKNEILTVHKFQTFEVFDRNAPVPVQTAAEKKPAPAQPKAAVQEEKKTQEPAAPPAKLFEKRKYPPLVLLPQANDPLANLTEGDLPSGVTMDMAKDPSNPDNIDSLTLLKSLAEELEKARTGLAVEGRRNDNKIVGDNWTKALRKSTIMEAKFGSGDIEVEQYIEMIKAEIEKDKKLVALYKAKGDTERMAFALETIKVIMKELKELEESLAAQEEA